MRPYDIIFKKRNGETLSSEEIQFLVEGYAKGDVPDYQMAAWLMAVFFRGLNSQETAALTMSMVGSGRVLDLSCIPGIKVDKHSTGGVGDKTTLVVLPLLAAAGVPIVKMSGRSLGHTGGTADKLESIPGFSVALTPEQMVEQVNRIGAAIGGQSAELVPADKKIYSLRDLTATVECIPLIAASVMSKKIAAGADAIVLDVKVGLGAFVKTIPEAVDLARAMVGIGREVGRETVAVITDMDQPLGCAVGNALEVAEAIRVLNGGGPKDLVDLCAILGGIALVLGKKASNREQGEAMARELLSNGQAASKLCELIQAQCGNSDVVDDLSLLPAAPIIRTILSSETGCITRLDAMEIARAANVLGAGRGEAGASPDLAVGVYLHKKIGDTVSAGDPLFDIHARTESAVDEAARLALGAFKLCSQPAPPRPLVYEVI